MVCFNKVNNLLKLVENVVSGMIIGEVEPRTFEISLKMKLKAIELAFEQIKLNNFSMINGIKTDNGLNVNIWSIYNQTLMLLSQAIEEEEKKEK